MPTNLPNRLKQLRTSKDWSLQKLADLVGCTHSTIDKFEKGATTLTVEWAMRIAPALGVHWTALFEDSPAHLDARLAELNELTARLKPDQIPLVVQLLRQLTDEHQLKQSSATQPEKLAASPH